MRVKRLDFACVVLVAVGCSRTSLLATGAVAVDSGSGKPLDSGSIAGHAAPPTGPAPVLGGRDAMIVDPVPMAVVDAGVASSGIVGRCPKRDEAGVGINTAIVVRATANIDSTTVSESQFFVTSGAMRVPGAIAVSGASLHFVPDEPLPANSRLQVTLGPGLRDTSGRALVAAEESWSFVSGSGVVTPPPGFHFSPPRPVPRGDYAITHLLAGDMDEPMLAWSTGSQILAAQLKAGGALGPVIEAGVGAGQQVSVSVVGELIHFAWADRVDPSRSFYSRSAIDASTPATRALSLPLPMSGASAYTPVVAADSDQRVALAWEDASLPQAWVATSYDGGATFAPPAALRGSLCAALIYAGDYLVTASLSGGLPGGGSALLAAVSSDNGISFSEPVVIAAPDQAVWCPKLVRAADGDVLVLYQQGPGIGARATKLARFTPATGAVSAPLELHPPAEFNLCSSMAAAPDGRVVVTHIDGSVIERGPVTDLRSSDDDGRSFGAPAVVDFMDGSSACPALALGSDGMIAAWRRDRFELLVSAGTPKRPCQ